MKHPNELLIERFYTAFQSKDFRAMQECYHSEAAFSDPVFVGLSSREVKGMWQMLITSGRDLTVAFRDIKANDSEGSAHWEAWYTFSRTGRKVHNVIDARMQFRNGLIWRHEDGFSFWRWSRQALGMTGYLMGWTPLVRDKVRNTARRSLEKFMKENPV